MGDRVRRNLKRAAWTIAGVVVVGASVHVSIRASTRILPPTIAPLDTTAMTEDGGIRRIGTSYVRTRAGVREVYLEGSPERIGASHARLLREAMIGDEGALWGDFTHYVPVAAARALMMDVGAVRYRDVDQGMPEARRHELAAEAEAFQPDPFASHLPTYHRLVFLHALYDIALSFEHSPLIGCSAFVLGPGATTNGHTLLGRAFDFEAGEEFDRDKAVFFVREDGAIPFASVAWPGLIGVMTGMNAEGVAIVVNGARAREPRTEGEPVVFALRDVLEQAHDVDEAVAILKAQRVMVSHLVMVADAKGRSAIVERAPGAEATVRASTDPDRVPLTNHFEGPLADDPRNQVVRAHTTTLARRTRLDEMLAQVGPHEADVNRAVAMLRDHDCAGGVTCALGDRRAIDALIATHGIVADTTDRTLWVSSGPHLSGAFVRFDLKAIFAKGHDPALDPAPLVTPEDVILHDGRYAAGRAHAGGPRVGGRAVIARRAFTTGSLAIAALAITRAAKADPIDDVIARVGRARANLKTLVGPFTQERTIGLLAASVRSTGTVTLVRPDRLRWELAPPDDVVYWITPEGLAYRSKTGQGHVGATQSKLAASLDDLRTLLGGDLAKLRARYDLHLVSDANGELAFDAVPRDPTMPLKGLRFGLGEDGAVPRFAELVEGARDKTRIDFGALKRDVAVDPALVRAPL